MSTGAMGDNCDASVEACRMLVVEIIKSRNRRRELSGEARVGIKPRNSYYAEARCVQLT